MCGGGCQVKEPIVEVDEVLQMFGTTRRSSRVAYVRTLKGAVEEAWIGEEPGRLPWWRLGRPPKDEDEDPEAAVRRKREREQRGHDDRPTLSSKAYIERGARILGVSVGELRGRLRHPEVVRAREALAVVGVERYGLKVKDLAREMEKSPDSVTKAIVRTTHRRAQDADLRSALDRLDQELASADKGRDVNNGGTA